MVNPFAQFVEKQDEVNPFRQFVEEKEEANPFAQFVQPEEPAPVAPAISPELAQDRSNIGAGIQSFGQALSNVPGFLGRAGELIDASGQRIQGAVADQLPPKVEQPRFTPEPEPFEAKTQNPFKGLVGRAAELSGAGIEAVAEVGERLGDRLEKAVPLSGLTTQQIEEEQQLKPLFDWAKSLKDWGKDIGYTPSTQLKDLAENPLTVVPFVAERVVVSAPDMAAAVFNLPAYVTARTKEILDERVRNDNKTLDEATVGDVVAAAGAATIEATLERFATRRLGPGMGSQSTSAAGRIAKEGAVQAGTEAVEEGASYLGETAGTLRGADITELGLRSLEGAIVGGGLGATVQTGKEGVDVLRQRQAARDEEQARIEKRQADVAAATEQLGPTFDALVGRFKSEGMTEFDAIKAAGAELMSGRTKVGRTEPKPGRTESGVPVPSGQPTGGTVAETTGAAPASVAAPSDIAGDVAAGERTVPATVDQGTTGAGVDAGLSAIAEAETKRGTSIADTRKIMDAYITDNAEAFADDALAKAQSNGWVLNRARKLYQEGKDEEAFSSLAQFVSRGRVLNNEAFAQALKAKVMGVAQTTPTVPATVDQGTAVDQLYRDLPPEIAEAVVERANEMVEDGRMQGAEIPFTTALGQARTAVVEELFGGFDSEGRTITADTTGTDVDARLAQRDQQREQASNFATRSVDSAVADQDSYGSLEESLQANRENVVDTLAEQGITDPAVVDTALAAFDAEAARVREANKVPADQATETTPASQVAANPETGLKPPGKRGRKPVERTPEQQAAAEQQRKERQKVGRDSIRTAEKARAVVEKPFSVDDYDNMDAARAAATELQQERDIALVEAYRILNDKNISPTAKAKQIAKTVIDHPSVDAQEKARAQQRAKLADTARSGFLADSTNSQPDTFYEGVTDATQAVDHIIKTGNPFEKLLAQRIKAFLKGVKVVIVNDPNTDIPDAKTRSKFKGAMGMYAERDGQRVIYLNNQPGLRGINNMTFLHEGVHGATMGQINAWIKDPNSVSPQVRAAIKDMQDVMLQAYKYYAVLNVAGKTDPLEDALFALDAFTDLKEFVAYGMTQPEMQDFLMKVPGQYKFADDTLNRGLLTKFVQSLRKMFNMGPQHDSAFQDLIVVTDRLLRAGPAPAPGSTIMALAKKVAAKQNKTLVKIAKSRRATDLNAGIGEIMMQTRNATDAVRFMKSAFDALSVGAMRKLLGAFTTADITRMVGKRIANLSVVNDAVQDMAGMRAKAIRELAEKVPAWVDFGKKYEEGAQALGDVMHASTLLAVDPTAYTDMADALQNDAQLKQLRADYQAALQDPAKSPKQRNTAKGNVTKRENEIKSVFKGGVVVNPHTNERYDIAGWEKLGTYGKGEGHRIYRMAKEAYQNTFATHQKLLLDKITKSSIPGTVADPSSPKGQLIAQITQTFQEAQQLGVYFPLMRYGNFWLRIGKGKAGEFYMFESATARNNFARKRAEESGKTLEEVLEAQDYDIGDSLQDIRNDVAESSATLKSIFKSLDDNSQVDPVTGRTAITDVDAIKDQVYQMFLMTLPDRDMRKRFTHRQGKTGFSADVLRNFVVSQHTAANQLARLAYADKIRLGLASAYAELDGNPDKLKLSTYVDEMARRATDEMTPQPIDAVVWDKVASVGNQAVFFYMLTAPKSAIIQLTQLPIVGLPALTAKYGAAETTKITARYSNLFNKLGTTKRDANGEVVTEWGEPSVNDSAYVNEHPNPKYRAALKRAWQAGQDKDLFMSTYASDMTSRAQAPTGRYEGPIRTGGRAVANFMSGAFHHLERIAREIMYMSTFELEYARAKKAGLSEDAAIERGIDAATEMVYEALFDYTQYNKPRYMKMTGLRLGTQFMSYPLQMTSYLTRNFYGMLPYLNRDGKREAAIKFFGTMSMTAVFGGVTGLWGYSTFIGVMEGLREALRPDMDEEDADMFYDEDDDGNPLGRRNLDLWFREWFIPTYFGPNSSIANALGLTEEQALMLQRSVKMGPVSALTDLNISPSVSLDGMWFRDNVYSDDAKTAVAQMTFNLVAGPFGSMVLEQWAGVQDFLNGDFNKGVEKMLPAFFRGTAKALRIADEGEVTRQGAEIRDAEWFTTGKLIGLSLGFQSAEVGEIKEYNFRAKKLEKEILKARLDALNELDKAVQKYDQNPTDATEEGVQEALDGIREFNYRNGFGKLVITRDTIRKSIEGRAQRRFESIEGLMLSRTTAPLIAPLVEKSKVPQE